MTVTRLVSFFVLFGLSVNAAIIPVDNPNFANPATGSFDFGNVGWSESGDSNRTGVIADSLADVPAAISGSQWGWLDSRTTPGGIFQSVSTIQPNTEYTLSLWLGDRGAVPLPNDFEYGLWADGDADPMGGIPLIVGDEALALANGLNDVGGAGDTTDNAITLSFTSPAVGGPIGENLFIWLNVTADSGPTDARQLLVDNVALTATPVPEPGTFALVGVFGLLGILVARREA